MRVGGETGTAVDHPDLRLVVFTGKRIGRSVTKCISLTLKVIWVLPQPATSLSGG
jgi:acyl-CoA reductase-like NAD-dependent aldehyde dehydrogenase